MTNKLWVQYSCKPYEYTRAKAQNEIWFNRVSNVNKLLITGDGNNLIHDGILRLECRDDYSWLINKTQCLFDWFITETNYEYLIKMDDDVWLSDNAVNSILSDNSDYGGLYFNWQYNYFYGPCYWLSRNMISKLPRLEYCTIAYDGNKRPLISFPEDMAVGNAVKLTGYKPNPTMQHLNRYVSYVNEYPSAPHKYDVGFDGNRNKVVELMKFLEDNK